MNQEIRDKKFYLDRFIESTQADIKLAQANLRLIGEKEKKFEVELKNIQTNKREWMGTLKEAEEKLKNPDPVITWLLGNDFRTEISLRRRGGDSKLAERYGESKYGIKYQHGPKRGVMTPRLKRDGEKSWYENEEAEIWDTRSNREAFLEWDKYMSDGLEIDPTWDFDKLVEEINKFFSKAPSLDRFGKSETVFVEGGEPYQQEDGSYTLGGRVKQVPVETDSDASLSFKFENLKKKVKGEI